MKFLLLMIVLHLDGNNTQIQHVEVLAKFDSEQACLKDIGRKFTEADRAGHPVPPHVSMGCVDKEPVPVKRENRFGGEA